MATAQSLKRKLQVIHSTQKLARAMKTSSTVKYSKLSTLYANYKSYEQRCEYLYKICCREFNSLFTAEESSAPVCYIIMSSNTGMCGSFNTELLSYAEDILKNEEKQPLVLICGKKAREHFERKGMPFYKEFVFEDVPSVATAKEIFESVKTLIDLKKISSVKIIYPKYYNMMKQQPVCCDLFSFENIEDTAEPPLFIPDRQTVVNNSAENILISIIYEKKLETALGAQAATLTTMRSAYDTACEYSEQLESEINNQRQNQVTADVIETSAEFSMSKEE